ncbi:hypothetical protein COEREDRAFT_10636, partial [Coemansia reversa NRRL 1564]
MLCRSTRRVVLAARPTWTRHALRDYSQAKPAAEKAAGEAFSPFAELGIRPTKRPDSAAYFMLRPKVSDMLAALRNMVQQLQRQQLQQQIQGHQQHPIQRKKWHSKEDLDSKFDIQISFSEYTMLLRLVSQAYGLSAGNSDRDKIVRLYLKQFQAGYKHVEVVQLPDPNKEEKAKQKRKEKRKRKMEARRKKAEAEQEIAKKTEGAEQRTQGETTAGTESQKSTVKASTATKPTTETKPNGGVKQTQKAKRGSCKHGSRDELGRWFAGGRRKTAQAFAWIAP